MKDQKKNIIILLVVLSIILYICLSNDFVAVVKEIININPIWFLVAIIYVGLYLVVRSINLNMILKKFKNDYPLSKTFRIVLSTSFFDAITPFSTGGQPAQIYMLKKDGFRVTDATNSVIQYSFVYQIALVLFGVITIILNSIFGILGNNILLKYFIILGFSINFIVIIVLIFLSFSKKTNAKLLRWGIKILGKIKIIKDPEEKIKKLDKDLERFVGNSKELFKNYKTLITGVLLYMIGFVFLYIIPLYLAYGLGEYRTMNILNVLVASSYVMMIGSFVPIPGGSGGIEYGFLRFFETFITGSKLKALMLLWRFVTYYMMIILGGISFALQKRKSDTK